jgi:Regulator of chromosome condensation (RCC1) repeat
VTDHIEIVRKLCLLLVSLVFICHFFLVLTLMFDVHFIFSLMFFSVCASELGGVHTFGTGRYGTLGRGSRAQETVPNQLEGFGQDQAFGPAVRVFAGPKCAAILADRPVDSDFDHDF